MSLVWHDPFRGLSHFWNPGRITEPEDFFGPIVPREFQNWFIRPWSAVLPEIDSNCGVTLDKDQFNVNVDVQQFRPNEISVQVKDNTITVEGKHEERQDEHGFISRQFVRRYVVPESHDAGKVESRLSSDGVLTITAPKIEGEKLKERQIPITHTGQPLKVVENKGSDK